MDFVNGVKRSARLLGMRPDLTLREASELIDRLSKKRKRMGRSNPISFDMETTTAALVPLPNNQRLAMEGISTK